VASAGAVQERAGTNVRNGPKGDSQIDAIERICVSVIGLPDSVLGAILGRFTPAAR
jgi:hypothetical protein